MPATTVARSLHEAASQLAAAGIDTPDLDAELLLARVLDVDRAWLIAHANQTLTPGQEQTFRAMVERRARREPLAYITGQRWFYDILLHVTPAVLIPRPETEELVELALDWLRRHPRAVVADIGTGSGAIALAIARHAPPEARILATDISPEALEVARANARRLGLTQRVSFHQGDLLAALPEAVDLIVANLPYVAERDRTDLMPEVGAYEPAGALFSGPAGLEHLRRLLAQAPSHLRPGGALLLEIGYDQGEAVHDLARQHFPTAAIRIHQDLAGHDRVLVVETSL
jgi:release factor glutamine methyltransferase